MSEFSCAYQQQQAAILHATYFRIHHGQVTISIISGIAGLTISYYWGTASGATIILFAALFYGISAMYGRYEHK
jgi:ABC-type Mn2+/Zn2+ transport system permease subunit